MLIPYIYLAVSSSIEFCYPDTALEEIMEILILSVLIYNDFLLSMCMQAFHRSLPFVLCMLNLNTLI